ncbi:hypothetical protein NDA01_26435 [Trichocoleus desertorum AS-A10]|uniref:hypothetical protein n=1 Tax=Trichocoleus desertorum TaxID=1481672 RepID=UPI003297C278
MHLLRQSEKVRRKSDFNESLQHVATQRSPLRSLQSHQTRSLLSPHTKPDRPTQHSVQNQKFSESQSLFRFYVTRAMRSPLQLFLNWGTQPSQ